MKKILAVLLVAVLAIGCFALTACGGDATFGGNYEEATAEDILVFATEAENAGGSSDIDLADGCEVKMIVKNMPQPMAPYGYGVADMEMTLRIVSENGAMKAEGTAKGKTKLTSGMYSGMESDTTGKVYWTDGYMYVTEDVTQRFQGQTATGNVKNKMPVTLDAYLDGQMSELDGFDFEELVPMALTLGEKMGLSIARDENSTKIKFVIPENNSVGGEIIFVFDANYNLTSMRYDVTIGSGEDAFEMDITYKPYSGSVSLPNDLDTYPLYGA